MSTLPLAPQNAARGNVAQNAGQQSGLMSVPSHGPLGPASQVNGPQIYNDYSKIGLSPPPLEQIEAGRQTPGYYRSTGPLNPSGTNMANGGYYTPDITSQIPRREFTPEQAIDQNNQHNNLDAQWAMRYPQGMLQPRGPAPAPESPASMQNLPLGSLGPRRAGVVQAPDGRKVVVGPTVDASTLGPRSRIAVDTGGDYKNLSHDELEQKRQNHISGQQQRADMLGAGRNISANQRYGAPLRPDLFPMAQSQYQPSQPGPLSPGNAVPTVTNETTGESMPDTSAQGMSTWFANMETTGGKDWADKVVADVNSGRAPWNREQLIQGIEQQQGQWEGLWYALTKNFRPEAAAQLEREKSRINAVRSKLGMAPWEPRTAIYPQFGSSSPKSAAPSGQLPLAPAPGMASPSQQYGSSWSVR